MKVIDYYLESWRRFRDLQGRTTRPAFWWPFLIHPIVFLVLGGIFAAILGLSTDQIGPEVVYGIAYVWVLITLGVRRLHEVFLLFFIAVVLFDKIDFPSPNKAIEKIIPNENLKIVK